MVVSATVTEACRTHVLGLDFGSVEIRQSSAKAQSLLSMTCTPGTAYAITLDNGRHGNRTMANPAGTAFLAYEIYRDGGGQRRWGEGSAGVSGTAPADGRVILAAYGRLIDANGVADRYVDTITVTVEF